ncbi:hypothetical protein [Streptomyces sp. NPDC001851]|uniref:hypothetical protein n=1 Tax=Streptomyces sp. NPDC001851 TaxID=3154529 RepID=UPI00331C81A5
MRRSIIGVCGGLLVVALGGYLVVEREVFSEPDAKPAQRQELPYPPGDPVPAQAERTAQDLTAEDERTQRAALVPELEHTLSAGRLLPKGTRLRLWPNSWHEEGGYANAQATLGKPGEPARHVVLAFAQKDKAWRITLVEEVK